MALRRRLRLELAKPEWSGHPLNEGDAPIEEKAFKLRNFAEAGDALAVQIFKQQGFILGYAIADMVRTLDPGLVVIGGGLAETSFRDQYMEWIQEGFADRAWPAYRFSPLNPDKVRPPTSNGPSAVTPPPPSAWPTPRTSCFSNWEDVDSLWLIVDEKRKSAASSYSLPINHPLSTIDFHSSSMRARRTRRR